MRLAYGIYSSVYFIYGPWKKTNVLTRYNVRTYASEPMREYAHALVKEINMLGKIW